MINLNEMGKQAKQASFEIANLSTEHKNKLLGRIAELLLEQQQQVLTANSIDISNAQAAAMNEAMQDRLLLNSQRLQAMASDIKTVINLHDPIGETFDSKELANGLQLYRQKIPLGVLGVIYEARPNVTIDIATLALKTGNAVILRGGKETIESNRALLNIIHQALKEQQLNPNIVQLIDSTDRMLVEQLLKLDQYVDMIIPRGGPGLQRFCLQNSTIPVITGGVGICHIYVDKLVNIDKAISIIINAKTQRPSVCNALDTLLINEQLSEQNWQKLVNALEQHGVKLKGDRHATEKFASIAPLEAGELDKEWLSLTLGIVQVANIDEAINHIREHSSGHSEAILSDDLEQCKKFVQQVNSAAVYVNASTRFTDGSQFGLGAEVAVSTQKLHARGPMGLEALTSYKWIGVGDYLTRG